MAVMNETPVRIDISFIQRQANEVTGFGVAAKYFSVEPPFLRVVPMSGDRDVYFNIDNIAQFTVTEIADKDTN